MTENNLVDINLDRIIPSPASRRDYSTELKDSIMLHGLQIPLIVEECDKDGNHLIKDGNLRFHVLKDLKFESAKCIVQPTTSNTNNIMLSLSINKSHTPLSKPDELRRVEELLENNCSEGEIFIGTNICKQDLKHYIAISQLDPDIRKKAQQANVDEIGVLHIINLKKISYELRLKLIDWYCDGQLKKSYIDHVKRICAQPEFQVLPLLIQIICFDKVIRSSLKKLEYTLSPYFTNDKFIKPILDDYDKITDTVPYIDPYSKSKLSPQNRDKIDQIVSNMRNNWEPDFNKAQPNDYTQANQPC